MAAVFAAVVVAWLNVAVSMTGTCALALAVQPMRVVMIKRPATSLFLEGSMAASYFVVVGVK
jgi:hypothetical protein